MAAPSLRSAERAGVSEFLARRAAEALGLGLLAAALIVAVALWGYDPNDPSLNHATAGPSTNPLGSFGASIADVLQQTLGLAAWLVVLIPPLWALRLIFAKPLDWPWLPVVRAAARPARERDLARDPPLARQLAVLGRPRRLRRRFHAQPPGAPDRPGRLSDGHRQHRPGLRDPGARPELARGLAGRARAGPVAVPARPPAGGAGGAQRAALGPGDGAALRPDACGERSPAGR